MPALQSCSPTARCWGLPVTPHTLQHRRVARTKLKLQAGQGSSDRVQQVREQAKTKLDKAVEDVEDKIDDDDSAGAMQELVGPAR